MYIQLDACPELTVLRNNFQLSDAGSGSTVLFFGGIFGYKPPMKKIEEAKDMGHKATWQ